MNLIAMLLMAADPTGQPLPDVVLLDFTASYCPPCQQMVPVLERMERDQFPIRKIDTTQHPETTKEYKVDRLPTMVLLVEGKEVKRYVGLTAEEELRQAMNDAARKLDMQRRAAASRRQVEPVAGRSQESFEDFASRQPPTPDPAVAQSNAPRSGIGGLFDRMKNTFTGSSSRNEVQEKPDVRAQSPDTANPQNPVTVPMQATVRVRLDDGEFSDVGTGTIVHSAVGQSTILTCAHIFKDGNARVEVEFFRGDQVLKYAASVVGGNRDSDIAFIRIQNKAPLPTAPMLAGKLNVQANDRVFSIGCNGGNDPTVLSQNVARVNYFDGPENIVCDVEPVQGRSGGGLFNSAGQLIGVCGGAFKGKKEGLYTGIGAVRELMTALNLNASFEAEDSPPPIFADASQEPSLNDTENPFADDDDLFERMFEEEATVFDEAPVFNEAPEKTAAVIDSPPETVRSSAVTPPGLMMAASQPAARGTEITVIIEDPVKGKKVVVIPKPSPWLIELLTGEPPTAESEIAAARGTNVSRTSLRANSGKPVATPISNGQTGSQSQLIPATN